MKRPLPSGPQTVRLCAKKNDCDVYNASTLIDMPGSATSCTAEYSGEKQYMHMLSDFEVLHLKRDCPILLLTF